MKKRQTFTREFKLEAVRLLEHGDKPAADLARELGIKRNQRGGSIRGQTTVSSAVDSTNTFRY